MSDYKQKVERIQELASNPETLSAHISNHIDGITYHLPNIAQSVANQISTSVGFLNSKIPKPKNQFPLSPTWEPSDAHKQKFDRYYDMVNDPISALGHIKKGSLTSEGMEALAACHPELLKQMQKQIGESASPEQAKKLPHDVKQSLSMFLGMPLNESMYQPVRAANQQALQNPVQSQSNQQMMTAKPSQKGLEKLDLAGRSKTQTSQEETDDA
jgi:hypothetical protein